MFFPISDFSLVTNIFSLIILVEIHFSMKCIIKEYKWRFLEFVKFAKILEIGQKHAELKYQNLTFPNFSENQFL